MSNYARQEVLYNCVSLFVGPSPSTGCHFQSGQYGAGVVGNSGLNLVSQLFRVQRYNNSFNRPTEAILELGQLAPVSQEQVTAPMPKLDFEYYMTNGVNEARLGFPINGSAALLSGILTNSNDDRNYFALYSAEGTDSVGDSAISTQLTECFGNGFISNLRFAAAVGGFAMATVSVEALNYAVFSGSSGIPLPSIVSANGAEATGWNIYIPTPATGTLLNDSLPNVIKYGDITLNLNNISGYVGQQFTGVDAIHLQSFDLSIPITRENLLVLGSKYSYAQKIRPPIKASLSISSIMTDLQTGNLWDIINTCQNQEVQLQINMNACSGATKANVFNIIIDGAILESQDFSLAIGSKRMTTAKFDCYCGGPLDQIHQIIISGAHIPNAAGL